MRATKIAQVGPRSCPQDTVSRVVGTMSGTSCDGLDVVLIEVDPSGMEVMGLAFKAFPYPKAWQERLRTLGSLTDADALDLEAEWTDWVMAKLHPLLKDWSNTHGPLHLLGFSGHTWYHEPRGRGTRAIGDAECLHANLGMSVVADYRSADVAAGGQGAPLVPLFDAMVFPEYAACLNLGGIANVTVQRPGMPVLASDLCGCNLLLNRQAQRMGMPFDRDGRGASAGVVDANALAQLQAWGYLNRPWPKSLAAEDLMGLHSALDMVPRPEDALATAVHWMAEAIAQGCPEGPGKVLVTGGGAHHPGLVSALRSALSVQGLTLNIPEGDWVDGKEAAAFAWLAWRTAHGRPTSLASVTGAAQDVCGGVLYGNFTPPGMDGTTLV